MIKKQQTQQTATLNNIFFDQLDLFPLAKIGTFCSHLSPANYLILFSSLPNATHLTSNGVKLEVRIRIVCFKNAKAGHFKSIQTFPLGNF